MNIMMINKRISRNQIQRGDGDESFQITNSYKNLTYSSNAIVKLIIDNSTYKRKRLLVKKKKNDLNTGNKKRFGLGKYCEQAAR